MFEKRCRALQERLREQNVTVAFITDDDSVYYFSGYYDYLHMEFGRPTILVVPANDEPMLITPQMELEMARTQSWIEKIHPWQDGLRDEWRRPLQKVIDGALKKRIGIEPTLMPPAVRAHLDRTINRSWQIDVMPTIANMRAIKSEEEQQLARHAGEVAGAMMQAAHDTIAADVPEYEVALATSSAGTRKAAELLSAHYDDPGMSPNTHFLQIMASGDAITQPHHRPTTRVMQKGDPVFMCFCGMTNFHRFKLGFDRTFWIGEIANKQQEAVYKVAVESQAAALSVVKAGMLAEDVHAEYAEVIQSAGFDFPFRCGRATGYSFLEKPQLVFGDKTELKPGMVLAVDGSVSVEGEFRAQVGDSIIVTEDGYEPITSFSKSLDDVVIA
ncbi:MAG: Xaa-Pro peptidase family protein [Pseudomonadota bacterium]